MSRSQNLRHNVINQVIDDMARGHIPSPLPTQNALAEMYNISRTTVRPLLSAPGALSANRRRTMASTASARRWPSRIVSLSKHSLP